VSACEICGHPAEGNVQPHWTGCQALGSVGRGPTEEERALIDENHRLQNLADEELKAEITDFRPCAFGGCQNEVIGDKRVKYCEDHRDVKSRKE